MGRYHLRGITANIQMAYSSVVISEFEQAGGFNPQKLNK
jgi:hypothetical protein